MGAAMTDTRKLCAVFRSEYEATGGNLEAAVAAVATTVKAQLDLPFAQPTINLTVTVVQRQVRARLPKAPPTTIERVVALAATAFGLEPRRMRSAVGGRTRTRSEARWVAAAVLRGQGLALTACGRAVGLDHSTVLYGLRQIAARPELEAAVARVSAQVQAEIPTATASEEAA